jgi:multidrug transporter EmrE-like cation transporter
MIVAYGVANLLQSAAAARTTVHHTFDPALLLRLAGHRTYLVGLTCQMIGFALAFLARRDLPLFLVQASVAAGLGVTALLGVLLLKWRLPVAEVVLLVLLFAGITALVLSARPAQSRQLGPSALVALVIALGGIGALGFFAVRLHGAPGSVALGSLAGLAFSAAAVAARPLAAADSSEEFLRDPLLYLLIAHSLVGQLLLGLAMQRGSTTAAVAAMDAAGAVPAAIVGLLWLNDKIWPGREWLAAAGFLVTLTAVIGLTRYAEPQHHHAVASGRQATRASAATRAAPANGRSFRPPASAVLDDQGRQATAGWRRRTTRS